MELSDIQLGGAVAVSLGAEVLDDHKAEAHDDAGDDTAGEHLQDGDIGDDGIHEHTSAMTYQFRFGSCSHFILAVILYLLCLGQFLLGRAKFK